MTSFKRTQRKYVQKAGAPKREGEMLTAMVNMPATARPPR